MKVILKQDYELLGDSGQLVEVKDGYARNFLIPRGIATIANKSNLKSYEEIRKQQGRKIRKQMNDAQTLADELAKHTFNVFVKTGEDDKIFGSVTSQMIFDEIFTKGFEAIEKRKIILKEPIKSLGEHEVEIKLQHSIIARVKVMVEKESDGKSDTKHNEVTEVTTDETVIENSAPENPKE